MILQLKQTLESTKSRSLRRGAILKSEREAQTHLANMDGFLRVKYGLKEEELTRKAVEEAQRRRLYSEISSKTYHGKLYRAKLDPVVSMEGSTLWLKHSSIKPREGAAFCNLQDRNMFWGAAGPCPHCQNRQKIVEVGITSFDNPRAVETEKKSKHDHLANHCAAMYKAVSTRIIPYVMTWEGLVTTFHGDYCKELRIDRRTEAYVQTRMLKMTLESISMEWGVEGHRTCRGGDASRGGSDTE